MIHWALSLYVLMELVQQYWISSFKGIFMRDDLPKRTWKTECGIVNLDVTEGKGTHWACWYGWVHHDVTKQNQLSAGSTEHKQMVHHCVVYNCSNNFKYPKKRKYTYLLTSLRDE